MHRRSFLAGLGLSPLAAVAAIAAPVKSRYAAMAGAEAHTAVTPGVSYLLGKSLPPVVNGVDDFEVYLGSGRLLGDEDVRKIARHSALEVIEQYDRSMPSRMARHMSQRG
ncbi:hypothetical protein [Mesorhizobium sp.]|uniref:hypothetical protein n=1 Tax=Mesorhizobium sp. TaxID=1871066 RepID=UPI000FE99434|nr:hypothetical protein [Mesorhizobium sp.]RWP64916.1 MAG: hypothetical protein EOR08_08355 [Mesorhizobium sp.]